MPNGGNIRIKTENCVYQGSSHVLLSFFDTGCGIKEEDIPLIFDPFFSTKDFGKGTGLGLSVTYGIVRAHNGCIFCESKPGQGTVFKIYLPAAKTIREDSKSSTLSSKLAKGKETVLLVDDEESILNMVQKMLSRLGYQTFTAISGEEALALYKEKKDQIHAVILDLSMPGMGGKKCIEELIRIAPDVKIIASSGYFEDGLIKDTLSYGAKKYLVKPYSNQVLSEALRDVLD